MKVIEGTVSKKDKDILLDIVKDTLSMYDFSTRGVGKNQKVILEDNDMVLPIDLHEADFSIEDGVYKYNKDNGVVLPYYYYSKVNGHEEYDAELVIGEIIVKNNKIVDIKLW